MIDLNSLKVHLPMSMYKGSNINPARFHRSVRLACSYLRARLNWVGRSSAKNEIARQKSTFHLMPPTDGIFMHP